MKRKTILAITIFFIVQVFVTGYCCKLPAKEKVTLESNGVVLVAYDTCHSYKQWRKSYSPLAPLANMATLGLLQDLWTNHIEFQGYKFKCFDGAGTYYITKLHNKYYCSKSDKIHLLKMETYIRKNTYAAKIFNTQTDELIEMYVLEGKLGKYIQLGCLDENNEFQPNKEYLY